MNNEIPNLWATDNINLNIISPLAIMRTQAGNLETMTRGLLKAVILPSVAEKSGNIFYAFDIIAPALNNYQHRLFSVRHASELVYPVTFYGSSELQTEQEWMLDANSNAYSESDFINKLGYVLQSAYTVAIIQSLIARSNDETIPLSSDEDDPNNDEVEMIENAIEDQQ